MRLRRRAKMPCLRCRTQRPLTVPQLAFKIFKAYGEPRSWMLWTAKKIVKEKLQVFLSDKKLVAWSGHFGSRLTCHQRHDFLSFVDWPGRCGQPFNSIRCFRASQMLGSWTETPYLLFRPPMWDLFTIWHGEYSIHEGEATGIHGGRLHPLGNRFRTIRPARWHHPQQVWKGK